MILLLARSRQALPALPVQSSCRRMLIGAGQAGAEARLRAELESGKYELVISTGFAAAADQRMQPGDLLLATRVFGGADVFIDPPSLEAPGAVRGTLCTLRPEEKERARAAGKRKRLPPVHAFDDHAFWLARLTHAAGVPCLLLRSILLPAPAPDHQPNPLIFSSPLLTPGRIAMAMARRPSQWRDIPELLRAGALCRRQLASALTILLVLHDRAAK